ncbi:YvcK family protein [Jeotgalibacillus sp. R-1-5s-1]|uniref:gluconeogenesis factor YvcK family protein n=1 Tax=Jeotgalibacillus sp. R-1-5s-1 TaxID=2555897 RepID=UPI0010690D3F|nr:YvcK family protein [Jeotgalibacillus sp. R-1-5s-1]TFD95848.1 YvcK family protein [Jeotgalibacillus sp. R-1-5s-1]
MKTKRYQKGNVVVIGGGTGLSVLLRGLKQYPINLTAIVTVADDGGSSGRIRSDLNIPPPGDIRNVLAALSDVEPLVEEMFQYRFASKNELGGHSLGNLIIAAMTSITGDFAHGIEEMSKVLNVRGRVLPSANQSLLLSAEMEDGTVIRGESKIPFSGKKISRVYLTPEHVKALPQAVEAIEEADMIIIGPGSLYTSILPNLLVKEIGEAVIKSTVPKVYICNLMTQAGETLHYTASNHIEALYDHMGERFIDYILVNNEDVPEEIRSLYDKQMAEPVKFDVERLRALGLNVVYDKIIMNKNGLIRHDTDRVAEIIVRLIAETKNQLA